MKQINEIIIGNIDELHQYINDETIYYHYFGEIHDNMWISSPFRSDTDPSFNIKYENNKIKWVDYGRSNSYSDAVGFVQEYENLTYREALNFIFQNIFLKNDYKVQKKEFKPRQISISYCNIRNINSDEYSYWKQIQLTTEDIKKFKIYSGYIHHNNKLWGESTKDNPLFIYMFDILNETYKGYRPYEKNKKMKFYGHNIKTHIQGWEYLPDIGELLIITKSYKDCIVWWKLGIPAIAPHSENMFIPEHIIEELKKRFKKVYVNYDNDKTGIEKCIEFTNLYGLNYFNLPSRSSCKDPFQFVLKEGYNSLNDLLIEKIKRDEC